MNPIFAHPYKWTPFAERQGKHAMAEEFLEIFEAEPGSEDPPVEVKSTESAQGRTVEFRRSTQTVSLPESMIPSQS